MAKINIEFDTITKQLDAAIDGMSVENVRCVDICVSYDDDDEYRCCITTIDEDEATNIKSYVQMMASEIPAASIEGAVASNFSGFVIKPSTAAPASPAHEAATPQTRLCDDVAKYFGLKK
jgi:hypothetical protein